MLQVRENEISQRKWSDGTAQLRTVPLPRGALVGLAPPNKSPSPPN